MILLITSMAFACRVLRAVDKAPRETVQGPAVVIIAEQNCLLTEPTTEFGRAPTDINSDARHE